MELAGDIICPPPSSDIIFSGPKSVAENSPTLTFDDEMSPSPRLQSVLKKRFYVAMHASCTLHVTDSEKHRPRRLHVPELAIT